MASTPQAQLFTEHGRPKLVSAKTTSTKYIKQRYSHDLEFRERLRRNGRRAHFRKYGITEEDYDRMFERQSGCCAICGDPPMPKTSRKFNNQPRFHIDHDHTTGKVRGLLCNYCNSALGQAKDDPSRLRAMAAYLEDRKSF